MTPVVVLAFGCACGGAPAVTPQGSTATAATAKPRQGRADHAPIDPIAALAPVDDGDVSWLVPGQIQLELGGARIDAPGGNRPLDVSLVDRQGSLVRVAIRLPHARFVAWAERNRLYGVLAKQHRFTRPGTNPTSDVFVALRPGARVQKLARKGGQTHVRFVGAVEVEGWIPDALLGDAGPRRGHAGRVPSGRRTISILPGAIIRAEPRFAGAELAKVSSAYVLDTVREIDDAWVEVVYTDADVTLHGFVSRRAPPGRLHRLTDAPVPPPAVTPTAKVASGTCLYAKARGDIVGYIVGDRDALVEDQTAGWWTVAIDTPWGPIAFAAKGTAPASLDACAPPGSVPPPATRP